MSAESKQKGNATVKFIRTLTALKPGALGLLRAHAGAGLDRSVDAFDLFAGLWWPLRQKYKSTPQRDVAWLIAKLYAAHRMPQQAGCTLAQQLRRSLAGLEHADKRAFLRLQHKFDELLTTPLELLEPQLGWALTQIRDHDARLDWAALTDELSIWEREYIRLRWAEQFLNHSNEPDHTEHESVEKPEGDEE